MQQHWKWLLAPCLALLLSPAPVLATDGENSV